MMNTIPRRVAPTPVVETIKNFISLLATCIGLAIIVVGLKYTMDIFLLIFTILKTPTLLQEPVRQIAEIIGGVAFDRKMEGGTMFLANIMALTIYCCGALVCAWLTLALMQTGAKIVSLNLGDQNAVKRILQSAFGKKLQSKENSREDQLRTRDKTSSQA